MGCGTVNRSLENASDTVKKAEIIKLSEPQEEDRKIMHDDALENEGKIQSSRKGKPLHPKKTNSSANTHWLFQYEEANQAEDLLVKPWQGILKVPEYYEHPSAKRPSLGVNFVFGYQCSESRNNLFFTQQEKTIVFPAGIFGVVYNYEKNSQSIYKRHEDEIISLCLHKETDTVATGDKKFLIAVWNCRTLVTYTEHKSKIKGILGLSFCVNSDFLAVIKGDFRLYLYKWQNFSVIFCSHFGSTVYFVASSLECFCVVGKSYVGFASRSGYVQNGVFGNKGKTCDMTCAVWAGDRCYTAASNGQVYVWTPPVLETAYQVLELGVTIHALKVLKEEVYCAGADNTIVVLSKNFEYKNKIVLSAYAKSMDFHDDQGVVGLANGEVCLFSGNSREMYEGFFQVIHVGFCQEIIGIVEVSPGLVLIATCDEVSLIDYILNKKVEKINRERLCEGFNIAEVDTFIRCVDYDKGFSHIFIGFGIGFISILHYQNSFKLAHFSQISDSPIVTAKYCPKSLYLACTSEAGIFLLSIPSYNLMQFIQYSFPITSIDWSLSSTFFQTCAANYDLNFWNLAGQKVEELNEPLATWSSKVGWQLKGLNEDLLHLSHVTCAKGSHSLNVLACGDDWGGVHIFKILGKDGLEFKCNASHIRALAWTAEDDYLFVSGNRCIVQFSVSFGN